MGVLPQLFSGRSTTWGSPVLPIRENSAYGFAFYNTGPEEAGCRIDFRSADGEPQGDAELLVPGNGQIAQFAASISSGFSGTATVRCDQEVIVMGLVQDLMTGFPTNLNYSPVDTSGPEL